MYYLIIILKLFFIVLNLMVIINTMRLSYHVIKLTANNKNAVDEVCGIDVLKFTNLFYTVTFGLVGPGCVVPSGLFSSIVCIDIEEKMFDDVQFLNTIIYHEIGHAKRLYGVRTIALNIMLLSLILLSSTVMQIIILSWFNFVLICLYTAYEESEADIAAINITGYSVKQWYSNHDVLISEIPIVDILKLQNSIINHLRRYRTKKIMS